MLGLHEKWRDTFMEAWPDQVLDLGLPAEEIPLSRQDSQAIGARNAEFRSMFDIDELPLLSEGFRASIASKLKEFDSGAHARLGGCSFKRSGAKMHPLLTPQQVETLILQDNPRVTGLVASSLQESFPISLFLRPWVEIPHWSEFRMFMKGRKFFGASQYFHPRVFPEIESNLDAIAYALVDFSGEFSQATHIDDAIVDVYLNEEEAGKFKAVLLDINPLIQRADPCLFQWKNDGDFDGGLRFRNTRGRICSVAPLPFAS